MAGRRYEVTGRGGFWTIAFSDLLLVFGPASLRHPE